MTRDEASAILELSPHATPAERAAQYDMLRRQLEDKLARAPTPGLREKYRTSLKQLEEAVAILSQTDDSAALPVLQKQAAASKEPATGGPAPVISTPSSRLHAPRPAGRKSGSREFALVAVIAIIVLAGGGWFVLKTRAENAEKARLAAAAKAEGEKIRLQLRTIVAEAKIAWEIAEREERDAERRTSELRSELRSQPE